MSWRTVIVDSQSKLDYKMGYLVVRGLETKRVLLDEMAVLVIANPAVSFTGFLIEALTEKKIKVVFCDSKRNPISELVPHHGSFDSSAKVRTQITWDRVTKGMVWRDIVCEKIRKQADFLSDSGRYEQANLLSSYVSQVELADATNREGFAAKVYFNAIFGIDFTRSADIPVNAALNYGYSLILSAFNREVSANGYLTQLGLFHDNMFNHFNLSCDLMEPFRILVDRKVYESHFAEFGKNEKHEMWRILSDRVYIDGQSQTVLNAIRIYVRSVFDAINDKDVSKIKFYTLVRGTD